MGRIQVYKVLIMQVEEKINGQHDVLPHCPPTVLKKQANVSIWARCLLGCNVLYHCMHLLESKLILQVPQIVPTQPQQFPVKSYIPLSLGPKVRTEMIKDDMSFFFKREKSALGCFQGMDEILPFPAVSMKVKQFGVCFSGLDK